MAIAAQSESRDVSSNVDAERAHENGAVENERIMRVLIANRGEIANRIERAVHKLGWSAQRVHVDSEPARPGSVRLPGSGVAGYLDSDAVVNAAGQSDCQLVHPGYGFLSESAELAHACAAAGIEFVGPDAAALELFGNKSRSRAHAENSGVPVLDATPAPASISHVRDLFQTSPGGIMIKAVAGGGGRGIRPVTSADDLDEAYRRCQSEAVRAFGSDEVYAERLVQQAKHIEVQIIGDGSGQISVLGERECSIQRRRQKLIEYAPSPALDDSQRRQLYEWARQATSGLQYRGLRSE